jgi:hypothetical protein
MTARLAIIGVGPTGTAVLERVVANAPAIAGLLPLEIHLVDPHPPGAGRVWRHEQSRLLWTNSMAEDVTMFTDDTVHCEGPIVPGPSLHEWLAVVGDDELDDPELVHEVRSLGAMGFPTRQLQSAYLAWVFRRVIALAPPGVSIVVHPTSAVDLTTTADPLQVVHLEGGGELAVDAVILTLGHLDVSPAEEHDEDQSFAARHRIVHLPPDYTADIELNALDAGAPVIVRGLGLAFVDLMVLVTEGRGGRFVPDDEGGFLYEPSGDEPILYAGSRRGVPYRSKLGYRLQAARAPVPRFFDRAAIDELLARRRHVEFRPHVWPLLAKDVAWSHYHELFHAHPERVGTTWPSFDARFAALAWGEPELDALVEAAVPDERDRFDVERLDRPLAGIRLPDADALQIRLRDHIEADLARRADPAYSADLAAFNALLVGFGQVGQVAGTGRLTARSLQEDANGWWFSFFSYYASGPPAPRLRQLLALSRAGIVRFLGADLRVERDEVAGEWRATSKTVPGEVTARALVDARLPAPSVSRNRSPLVAAMHRRGELREHLLHDRTSAITYNTGKLAVDADLRIVDGGGTPHPRRFAAGIHTSRPAAGTFARPRTNALSFRQNDALARTVLGVLASAHAAAGDEGISLSA